MDRKEILERIRIILESVLNHKDFEMKEDLKASEVQGWDSLSHMMIISRIEDDFNIRFKMREINKLENLKSLIDLVQSKV